MPLGPWFLQKKSQKKFHACVPLKSSHRMGDGRIFSINLCASLFNNDLSNEPNFDLIHLAGLYRQIG
jgi:hypothetical protein